MDATSERRIHRLFVVGVLAKGAFALVEIVNGVVLLLVPTATIVRLVTVLTEREVAERPTDGLAAHFLSWAEHFSLSSKTFAGLYLISHGVIKLLLVGALLRQRLWAYPASIAVFAAFIAYQLYRYTHTHSLVLIGLSLFDALVIWLVWLEWRDRRRDALQPG